MKSDKIREIRKRVNDTMENTWPQLSRESIKAPLNVVEAKELLDEIDQLTHYREVVEVARGLINAKYPRGILSSMEKLEEALTAVEAQDGY